MQPRLAVVYCRKWYCLSGWLVFISVPGIEKSCWCLSWYMSGFCSSSLVREKNPMSGCIIRSLMHVIYSTVRSDYDKYKLLLSLMTRLSHRRESMYQSAIKAIMITVSCKFRQIFAWINEKLLHVVHWTLNKTLWVQKYPGTKYLSYYSIDFSIDTANAAVWHWSESTGW